jgi:hypothetical protein
LDNNLPKTRHLCLVANNRPNLKHRVCSGLLLKVVPNQAYSVGNSLKVLKDNPRCLVPNQLLHSVLRERLLHSLVNQQRHLLLNLHNHHYLAARSKLHQEALLPFLALNLPQLSAKHLLLKVRVYLAKNQLRVPPHRYSVDNNRRPICPQGALSSRDSSSNNLYNNLNLRQSPYLRLSQERTPCKRSQVISCK